MKIKPVIQVGTKTYIHRTKVAEILGCSLSTVERHIKQPRGLKAFRIMGHIYILQDHLHEFIRSCQQRRRAF